MISGPRAWSIGVLGALLVAGIGCRFRTPGARWIEAHGDGRAVRLAGRPAGVVAIGPDARLYAYPTDYASPWRRFGGADVKAIAASTVAHYTIGATGEVVRGGDGDDRAYPGSVGWGATALAASEDDRLFVVVGGHARRVEADELRDVPCGDVAAVSIAAGGGGELYVVDAAGALHRGASAGCAAVSTPAAVKEVAVHSGRVVMVGTNGSVWRRRGEEPWQALPDAIKYRPGSAGVKVLAAQVTLSATTTWLLDEAGSVFLLSDES